jgi:cytochrome c553
MKTMRCATIVLAALGLATGAAFAGDAAAGKAKAGSCAGCHGAKGEGKGSNPPIAGMAEDKFIQAMKDYKSGKRVNAPMKGISAGLSDADCENLAAYYASLKK